MVGLLVGFFGLLPVLMVPAPKEDLIGGIGFFSWPEISLVLSISSLSYGWIIMRKLIKDNDYPPAMVNGITMFIGGILAAITSWLFEPKAIISDPAYFITILAIIIIVSNLLCHNLYGNLLKKYSPTFLSFASFLTPLFAAFYGWIFLSEKISWDFFISALCVFLVSAIFYQVEFRERKRNNENDLMQVET